MPSCCSIRSGNFEGECRFAIDDPRPEAAEGWEVYARGIAALLRERLPARARGIDGLVRGSLPGGGLSSSASVDLAYLAAFAHANEIEIPRAELVTLARRCENEFVGVACGILDPASIVGSEANALLAIDTRHETWETIRAPADAARYRWLVAFTGLSRHLAGTGFNDRVAECRSAARKLARAEGVAAERLGELDAALLERHGDRLEPSERRRARHVFSERERVLAGRKCWEAGDLVGFGALMKQSCESSIHDYETGSEELVRLQQILCDTPGVLGARFSGGGFGGCSIALVEDARAEEARSRVEARMAEAFPRMRDAMRVFLARGERGLRVQ